MMASPLPHDDVLNDVSEICLGNDKLKRRWSNEKDDNILHYFQLILQRSLVKSLNIWLVGERKRSDVKR